MNYKDYIWQVGFDRIRYMGKMNYINDGIAFYTDIREFSFDTEFLRTDMLVIIAVSVGELRVELNTVAYTLRQKEALTFRPNDIVANWKLSHDFNGIALCMTEKKILELFSESDLWDKAFLLAENPIIHISEGSLAMLNLYGEILRHKIKNCDTFYNKEIIVSVIKAAMYELMADIDSNKQGTHGGELRNQREILFQRFIKMLAGTQIKPRKISWYAERLCVTPKYISMVCKQVSGHTAFEWINKYVQMDIRHWLKNSNKTIKEIADLLDFPNISFFGKYCRAHFGYSPTVLRRQLRRQPDGGK